MKHSEPTGQRNPTQNVKYFLNVVVFKFNNNFVFLHKLNKIMMNPDRFFEENAVVFRSYDYEFIALLVPPPNLV